MISQHKPKVLVWFQMLMITFCLVPDILSAQNGEFSYPHWSFHTRIAISGNSHDSDPAGYTIFSGLAIEAALDRSIGRKFAVELSLRTESREVDRETPSGNLEPLGSLELIPVMVTFRYCPELHEKIHTYLGFGVSLTVAWEKSGFLDTYDMDPYFGPAIQLGSDFDLSKRMILNLDIRFNTFTANIQRAGVSLVRVKIDPLTMAAGIGFRF